MEDKDLELQLVSSEQAEELEYLGFPIKVLDIVDETYRDGVKLDVPEDCYVSENYYIRRCPSLELVAKWLRLKKFIDISIKTDSHGNTNIPRLYCTEIINANKMVGPNSERFTLRVTNIGGCKSYDDYEQALSAGIDKAIEILTNDNYEIW